MEYEFEVEGKRKEGLERRSMYVELGLGSRRVRAL